MINLEFNAEVVNDKFIEMFTDYTTQIYLLIGGAGSGKSYVGMQKIIIKAMRSKRRVLILRKVGATIKESTWELAFEVLEQMEILSLCKYNQSDRVIILPNGSRLIFKALDNKEKIKSITSIDDIVIEEATEFTMEDYQQLKLRLRTLNKNLQIHLFCNPVSKANWIYKLFFIQGELNAKIIHSTYKDNKFLPAAYIQQLKDLERTNYTFYKIYTLGEFATLDKQIITNYEVREFDILKVQKETNGEFYVGLDFGWIDPTAIVGALFDVNKKEIYIDKDFLKSEVSNQGIYNQLVKMNYSKQAIIADSEDPRSINEVKRLGAYRIKGAEKGPDSVIHGIKFLQMYKIIIHPSCTNFIEAVENYTWKRDKKTGEYIEEPNHEYSHLCDSLRYASEPIWRNKKLRTLDKKILGLI